MSPLVLKWVFKIGGPLLLVAAFVALGYSWGAGNVRESWNADVAERQLALAEADARAERVTTKIVTEYVDRVRVVREKGQTIVKEVPIYVTPEADAACTVPNGFVRVHDGAAQNTPVGAPVDSDGAAAGVALSEAGTVIADNYRTYHEVAEQLKALQKWVAEQYAQEE